MTACDAGSRFHGEIAGRKHIFIANSILCPLVETCGKVREASSPLPDPVPGPDRAGLDFGQVALKKSTPRSSNFNTTDENTPDSPFEGG